MGSRILPAAADTLRDAIRENHGREVFAIGDMDGGSVSRVTITARGQEDRVVALIDRPRAGQVVIHNHPSGDLRPSDPDMQLAGIYGEGGVGVVIVDNEVTSANWVVEPYLPARVVVSENDVRQVFERQLPRAIPGYEARAEQLEMALAVTASLNEGRPLAVEAGTGTGKSLAYLVPAALWSMANEAKVVISTFTRTLQAQLIEADAPSLAQAGLDVRIDLLQGRNNYLCRRRLDLAREESADDEVDHALLETLAHWSDSTDGSRGNLPDSIDGALWDRVYSSSELTLRARCPHFARCHWYAALRRASASHLLVVNHALLLADRSLVAEVGRGILPKYERLILDEAHHLEDAATGAATQQLTARAIRNALGPLLDSPRRPGALQRLARRHYAGHGPLPSDRVPEAEQRTLSLANAVEDVLVRSEHVLQDIAAGLPEGRPQRITDEVASTERFRFDVRPPLVDLAAALEGVAEAASELREMFTDLQVDAQDLQPLLDLKRAGNRAVAHTDILRSFLAPPEGHARWLERARTRPHEPASAGVAHAPVDVAATLRRVIWDPLPGTVCTSATLTVAGSFNAWSERVGAFEIPTMVLPSPYDHFRQAILGLPRDIAEPNTPPYEDQVIGAILGAVEASDGGAFVLCTSYRAVDRIGAALRGPRNRTVLCQGEQERVTLLRRFRADRRAVLVGTDSFWEGVSIQGEQLRLVIIPRIPFRVPTDPLHEARYEALEKAGRNPFAALTLPAAVLKLRQGYGRLIRSRTDRGVVLLLDSRVHSRRYGRLLLQSLPPARRVKGPISWVQAELEQFLRDAYPQNSGS